MRVERSGDRLVVHDQPLRFWIFYGAFVVGGCVVLGMVFSLPVTRVQLGLGLLIGLGNVLGGLAMLKREPASVVAVDRKTNEVRVRRWGVTGASTARFSLEQVQGAIVETSEHTDGGTVFRPSLILKHQRDVVPISRFWYQSDEGSRHVTDEFNRLLSESR